MAIRVTAAEVKEIVRTTISDAVVLNSMITNASLIIDEFPADHGMTDARLKLIELYLAAHFVVLTEERGGLIATELGDASDKYVDVYSEGYNSSRYGQNALALDISKSLAIATSPKLSALFRVV